VVGRHGFPPADGDQDRNVFRVTTRRTYREVLTLMLLIVVVAAFSPLAPPVGAASAPDGLSYQKTATVTNVIDGDTFDAEIDGSIVRIRIAGVNTNEIIHATKCWADEAKLRLTDLIEGEQVFLTARSEGSTSDSESGPRPLRHVYLPGGGGVFTDVAETLVSEGYGLPLIFISNGEPDFAERYETAFWYAAGQGVRLHDPTGCGAGPDQGMDLTISAIWDADGDDKVNVNGEYAKIRNEGSTPASLKDWFFQDTTSTSSYQFGDVTIQSGETLVVHAGIGTDTTTRIYLGGTKPMLSPHDGVFLIDTDEDLRFYSYWPCYDNCRTPEGDLRVLEVVANPSGVDTADNESVTLYNPTSWPVPAHDFRLESWPYVLDLELPPTGSFPNNGIVPPSGRVVAHVGSGTNSFEPASGSTPATIHLYWDKPAPILTNSGDTVKVVTLDAETWDCVAWGTITCNDDPGIAPQLVSHVERIAGPNRYDTAAALSASNDPDSISTVYMVTGASFPDGLVAAVAAGRANGTVLLTRPTSLPGSVRAELSRLSPDRIVIAGGPAAVSSKVESALGAYAATVTRLSGSNRYDTAALVAKNAYPDGADLVYIASGTAFPDALAAAPVAAYADGPVLLTLPNKLPGTTRNVLKTLKPSRIVVIGGEAAVSAEVFSTIESVTGATVTRQAGANRYSSATQLSKTTFPPGTGTVYIATGVAFPDGVSAAAASALAGGPMLLTRPDSVPRSVLTELERLDPYRVVVVGGTAAVSTAVVNEIRRLLDN
jgi:putative cell wall-binding protein/endonuclease YncB( thermonuclease family)